jgi:hypothetical protein
MHSCLVIHDARQKMMLASLTLNCSMWYHDRQKNFLPLIVANTFSVNQSHCTDLGLSKMQDYK